jgi:CDP-diacylglycerol--glycerol-3-phosphate 3-phosphatidyltransferase
MNIANKITLFRVILIPVFMTILLSNIPNNMIWALIIFIIASLTDALDGYIARSRNLITNFGKFIDPLADKLLVTSALLIFLEMRIVPSWAVMIIVAREFIVTGLRTIAVSQGVVIAASMWGKVKTVTQIIAIISILLNNFPFSYLNFSFDIVSFYIAVVITIFSGIDYLVKNKNVINTM